MKKYKSALITGGTKRIGGSIATHLIQKGYNVAVNSDILYIDTYTNVVTSEQISSIEKRVASINGMCMVRYSDSACSTS